MENRNNNFLKNVTHDFLNYCTSHPQADNPGPASHIPPFSSSFCHNSWRDYITWLLPLFFHDSKYSSYDEVLLNKIPIVQVNTNVQTFLGLSQTLRSLTLLCQKNSVLFSDILTLIFLKYKLIWSQDCWAKIFFTTRL